MPDTPRPAGADLARQALNAYRAKAANSPAGPGRKPRPRPRRTDRSSGRDPIGFGALLTQLGAEQGWTTSLDGGSLLDRWDELCPSALLGHVQPVAFDADTGRLDLRPASDAYAAQLRLLGGQLARHLNDRHGRQTVRTIRILPVGSLTAGAPAATPVTPPAGQAGPVRTRETASPGYRRALAAALENKPARDTLLDERIRAAVAASDRWLAGPANREPETAFTDAVAAREQDVEAAGPPPGSIEASIQAALRHKHTGREPRRLFQAS
ncbi:DciA family protein [Streptomyces fradiae]|uniref:DciA family protein n=1 Tax=Streptomyces fradiae TaxID=1906 RepID=UPI0036F86ECB